MFDIGFSEVLLIFVIALIVLGPEKLPRAASQVGRWIGRARAMARQFKEQLEEDLQRVSVINFWAPWAEPSNQMNAVVEALAEQHESILFLQVNPEELEEVAESFDIDSVPVFVVLRGHTLLGRVEGADAAALTELVAKHSTPAIRALSTSDEAPAAAAAAPSAPSAPSAPAAPAAPAAAPTTSPAATGAVPAGSTQETAQETPEQLNARIKAIMDSAKVVLFIKGSPDTPRCGFSRQAVAILRENDVKFTHFDILQDEAVRQGLKTYNNWPTFPQLIIDGELAGGLDILREMANNGELQEAVA